MHKFATRIETSSAGKSLLPWVALIRRGRQSVSTQLVALIGAREEDLKQCAPAQREEARDALEMALRNLVAFEYMPAEAALLESFFEKKLVAFEKRVNELRSPLPLHAALGLIAGNQIWFATSGEVMVLHVGENAITNLGEPDGAGPFHFDTFHSGTLNSHGYLLFVPQEIATLLKSEELKQLAFARSSERKLEFLEKLVAGRAGNTLTFRAIMLEAKPKVERAAEGTATSIDKLLTTEAATEDLLSPPLLRPILSQAKKVGAKFAQHLRALIQTYQTKPMPIRPRKPSFARPVSVATPKTVSSYLIKAKPWVQKGLALGNPALLRALPVRLGPYLLTRFNALPLLSKIVFIFLLTLIFIFSQSVLITKRNKSQQANREDISQELTAIQGLLESASAALIYENELSARSQVQEATAKLSALKAQKDKFTHERKDDIAKLQTTLNSAQDRLRHIFTIDQPQTVDEKLTATLGLTDTPHTSAIYNKKTYTLQSEANQVLKDGASWIKDSTSVKNGISIAVDGSVYVATADGQILELRKGSKVDFSPKAVDPPLTNCASGHSERSEESPANAGTPCIKKIWTNERSEFLYILDSTQKRVVVISKRDGLLRAQYQSPQFQDLKDFTIDEQKKIAYLLDSATTFSIPLSHF